MLKEGKLKRQQKMYFRQLLANPVETKRILTTVDHIATQTQCVLNYVQIQNAKHDNLDSVSALSTVKTQLNF